GFGRGFGGFAERFRRRLDGRDERVVNDLAEELFLIGEVEIDGALGDARPFGDVVETRGREATLGEYAERGGENLPGPLLRESAPPGLLMKCVWGHLLALTN